MRRLIRAGEIARAAIRLLARPLTFAEQQCFAVVGVQLEELPLHDQAATILDRVGVRRGGVHVRFVDGDHDSPGFKTGATRLRGSRKDT